MPNQSDELTEEEVKNPIPKIIDKGGKDNDGSWGTTKQFNRDNFFVLINVPLPVFMTSNYIPPYNSLHPLYPFAIAKDSRITNNIETKNGRAITVSTMYEILKWKVAYTVPDDVEDYKEAMELYQKFLDDNAPTNLPIQDFSSEPVEVTEAREYLYEKGIYKDDDIDDFEKDPPLYFIDIGGTGEEVPNTYKDGQPLQNNEVDNMIMAWRKRPFVTTAGTKLIGEMPRYQSRLSFWFFGDPEWYDDELAIESFFTNTVNDREVYLDGTKYDTGTLKIESIEVVEETWERPDVEALSLKVIRLKILYDPKTFNKEYENVSNLFLARPYKYRSVGEMVDDNKVEKKNWVLKTLPSEHFNDDGIKDGGQPEYVLPDNSNSDSGKNLIPPLQRIFANLYDPFPKKETIGDQEVFKPDPLKMTQFFGTRDDCFRLNPDSEPTEVSEPMYLDKNGFIIYPDPKSGKVNPALSPKITGYSNRPVNFDILHIPYNQPPEEQEEE